MQVHRTERAKNKSFKGVSKRNVRRKSKGRIPREKGGPRPVHGNFGRDGVGRDQRANMSKQVRERKRQEYLEARRARVRTPRVVALVALGPHVDLGKIRSGLLEFAEAKESQKTEGPVTIDFKVGSKKATVTLWESTRDLVGIMDAAKVADLMLFVGAPPPNSQDSQRKQEQDLGLDELGHEILSVLQTQGMPTAIGLVQGIEKYPKKMSQLMMKTYSRFFHQTCSNKTKVLKADNYGQIFRFIESEKLTDIGWRDLRSYVFSEGVYFEPDPSNSSQGTLLVEGFLRGYRGLNVNRMVHITGYGDYQLKKIVKTQKLHQKHPKKSKKDTDVDMKETPTTSQEFISHLKKEIQSREQGIKQSLSTNNFPVAQQLQNELNSLHNQLQSQELENTQYEVIVPDPTKQESLECLIEPDPLNREQSLITDQDILDAEEDKKKRRLIQMEELGISNYTDKWDDALGLDPQDDFSLYPLGKKSGDESSDMASITEGLMSGLNIDDIKEEDIQELEKEDKLKLKFQLERDEMDFPDEVDTPLDTPAKERFQKYRGLKNFKHSPWDNREELPLDYARIFQFEDYDAVAKEAASEGQEGVVSGSRVRLEIKDVSTKDARKMVDQHAKMPLIVSGLMEHEHKVSVLHFLLKRVPRYETPVKGKEPLVFHSGFRRFTGKPIYSQVSPGCDKQMVERYLQSGRFTHASLYGRVMYPPAPTLVFHPDVGFSGVPQLVATGKFVNIDADKLLIKRILLTGYPIRVHKKKAVIRYMFFTPEDIRWFSPVELRTKHGLVGRILEPVGTKGYMKCEFNSIIKPHDTVCMPLYKRQYPKLELEKFE